MFIKNVFLSRYNAIQQCLCLLGFRFAPPAWAHHARAAQSLSGSAHATCTAAAVNGMHSGGQSCTYPAGTGARALYFCTRIILPVVAFLDLR